MIIAELDGHRVEVLSGERCVDAEGNRHFRFFFRYLDTVPSGLVKAGVRVGYKLYECCRPGQFKNWRREEEVTT